MTRSILLALLLIPFYLLGQSNGTFTLKSAELGGQGTAVQVFNGFGCSGGNTSPQLNWEHPPDGTKSFAVTMYDPDAPTGSGWWHWVVLDIPAAVTSLPAGAGGENGQLPTSARRGRNDYGTNVYGGPCPPKGDKPHRYIITVFALPVEKLDVPENASPAIVGYNLNAQALAKASLIFYYGR